MHGVTDHPKEILVKHIFPFSPMRALPVLVALVLVLAACSSTGSGSSSASASASASTASASEGASESGEASESASAGDEYSLDLATSDLGDILVDQDGMTVYRFVPDTEGASTCTGGCLENWPAVAVDDGESISAGDGVTAEVDTFTRDDGTVQATVNGFPVYYFANDAAAGDTNGQGVGGNWYVVGADGEMIR